MDIEINAGEYQRLIKAAYALQLILDIKDVEERETLINILRRDGDA